MNRRIARKVAIDVWRWKRRYSNAQVKEARRILTRDWRRIPVEWWCVTLGRRRRIKKGMKP